MCSVCGKVQTIQRSLENQRPLFHIKDLWCPNCLKDTKFIELKDRDITYNKLLNKPNKNEIEQFVFEVLNDRKSKVYGKVR